MIPGSPVTRISSRSGVRGLTVNYNYEEVLISYPYTSIGLIGLDTFLLTLAAVLIKFTTVLHLNDLIETIQVALVVNRLLFTSLSTGLSGFID